MALMSQGNDALANAAIDGKALKAMDEAVAMRPDSAKAWGLAALLKALAAQGADPGATQDLVQQAHKAA